MQTKSAVRIGGLEHKYSSYEWKLDLQKCGVVVMGLLYWYFFSSLASWQFKNYSYIVSDEEINYHWFKMLKPWQGGVSLINCPLSVMQTCYPLGVCSQMEDNVALVLSDTVLIGEWCGTASGRGMQASSVSMLKFNLFVQWCKKMDLLGSWDLIS